MFKILGFKSRQICLIITLFVGSVNWAFSMDSAANVSSTSQLSWRDEGVDSLPLADELIFESLSKIKPRSKNFKNILIKFFKKNYKNDKYLDQLHYTRAELREFKTDFSEEKEDGSGVPIKIPEGPYGRGEIGRRVKDWNDLHQLTAQFENQAEMESTQKDLEDTARKIRRIILSLDISCMSFIEDYGISPKSAKLLFRLFKSQFISISQS